MKKIEDSRNIPIVLIKDKDSWLFKRGGAAAGIHLLGYVAARAKILIVCEFVLAHFLKILYDKRMALF